MKLLFFCALLFILTIGLSEVQAQPWPKKKPLCRDRMQGPHCQTMKANGCDQVAKGTKKVSDDALTNYRAMCEKTCGFCVES
ncbi:unnamed protein product [Gongylonema pulchrum]|uniref:ShKT domain-containing protein n=1 Tax=Gongylonema pulchrum TaxID=637853 RepID=A0A183DNR9_9BILA|nr:unnamed protein product [Gongylonema pulchrum]